MTLADLANNNNNENTKTILDYLISQGFKKGRNNEVYLKTDTMSIYVGNIKIDDDNVFCLWFNHNACELTDEERIMEDIDKLSISELETICTNIIKGDFSDFEFGNNCSSGSCSII